MADGDAVKFTGRYLSNTPQVSNPIDYTTFLTGYLKEDTKWTDLFNIIGNVIAENLQPAIDELALIRNPGISDDVLLNYNIAMMGFEVPITSLTDTETYLVAKHLGQFYVNRDASYSFINFLSFVKNIQLTPEPLYANSITQSVDSLIPYSQVPSIALVDENGNLITDGTTDILGPIDSSGPGTPTSPITNDDGQYLVTDDGQKIYEKTTPTVPASTYFPTTFYDVHYNGDQFIVDENIIYNFIILLEPMHLVFRSFTATYTSITQTLNFPLISQRFAYRGSLAPNFASGDISIDTGGDISDAYTG